MDPTLLTLLLLSIPIGILAGLGASVIGLTAWPLVFPLFLLVGNFSLHEALLSSMIIDLIHAVILTIYYQRKPAVGVDFRYGMQLGLTSGLVAIITAIIAFSFLEQYSGLFKGGAGIINLLFGVIFIFQALKRRKQFMKSQEEAHLSEDEPHTSKWYQNLSDKRKDTIIFSFILIQGFATGLIGVGGAMNIALVLIILLGYPALRAVGTAMTTSAIMLSALVVTYLILLNFVITYWYIVVIYIIVGSISCIAGVIRAQNIGEWQLLLLIGLVVVSAAVLAIFQIYLFG
jgi:uncharacterized membrane protein YfcA